MNVIDPKLRFFLLLRGKKKSFLALEFISYSHNFSFLFCCNCVHFSKLV